MITLHLTRKDDFEGVYLNLPATQDEIGLALSELDEISTDTSTTEIMDVVSNVYNLNDYLKNVDIMKPIELDKLNTLARKMQTMDRDSCYLFEGVLNANSVNGIDDILRLSESLDEYAMLPDVAADSALGKYLVNNGAVKFPESVRPYLDYQIIGAEFYSDHGGAFCRGGYVVRNEELPEQLRQSVQEEKHLMSLHLRAAHNGTMNYSQLTLPLPATETALDKAKQTLGIQEFAGAEIVVVDYSLPYLAQLVPQDCICVEDANELALSIEQMNQTDGELLKYLSVLEAEQPENFQEALRLAIDIDDYERVAVDADEYGHTVLERLGADEDLISEIDGYMDFESFGKDWMREDGVVQTQFGSVRRLGEPFETQEMGGMVM